jgi:hypothetical protein
MGNFGTIPYGTSIYGRVFYNGNFDHSFCNSSHLPFYTYTEDPDNINTPILLVDSDGKCPLANKAYNVQNIGGSVMLLVSRDDGFEANINKDDYYGKAEDIPTMIIKNSDGNKLKDFITKNPSLYSRINMLVKFESITKADTLKMQIFMRSDHRNSYNFFEEFDKYYKEIGTDKLLIEPFYKYTECLDCEENVETEGCVRLGKFCGPQNPYIDKKVSLQIVMENLRQKCIWFYGKTNNDSKIYWNYMLNFYKNCFLKEKFNDECSALVSLYLYCRFPTTWVFRKQL